MAAGRTMIWGAVHRTAVKRQRIWSSAVREASGATAVVEQATDTLDLMDNLLGTLASKPSAYVFFDLDETLVTRDTCLVDGFRSTRSLMEAVEEKLGRSSEAVRRIRHEMEKDYYDAPIRLVDPLLARVIRSLKVQGHYVYGLTSNELDDRHTHKIVNTLSTYKIRFSKPVVKGELPRSGALVMDHPVVHGVVFGNNHQTRARNKGEVMAEFVGLSRDIQGPQPTPGARSRIVLVDNTQSKCDDAARSFTSEGVGHPDQDLHCVHYMEAENVVDWERASAQLARILERLRAQHLLARGGSLAAALVAENWPHGPASHRSGELQSGGHRSAGV